MGGLGEHYYELHVDRRSDAGADEATLRRVSLIKKLQERAHFSQDEHPDPPPWAPERVLENC